MESTGPPTRRPPGLEFAFRLRGHTRGSSSNAVHKLGNPNAFQLTGQNATHQEALTLPPIPGILIFKETAEQPSDYLDEERHECWLPAKLPDIAITWRLKERMKSMRDAEISSGDLVRSMGSPLNSVVQTVSVALVLCLNIGTDPPDVIKISPCARKECWFDPRSLSKAKAIEAIGNNLQAQYERWQARAKYRQALDPTMDDVKKLCASLRRNAKNDRVLFHYNGHGVPRPTSSGEIWVFNKTYTQYIPLSIYDLRAWVGNPSIYVLDCSGAGVLLPHFLQNPLITSRTHHSSSSLGGSGGSDGDSRSGPSPGPSGVPPAIQRDCIVLAPCAANELLPMNPKFPADIFTACLTTPIFVALRWFITQNRLSMGDLDPDFVDQIPGKLQDRKTPLGELNWIFTAITDTIAWNTLPSPIFQRLFRQDQLVASLFRNFLLADRVLRSFNCTPSSIPRLPSTAQHPLWQAWDLAAECCLSQLINERNPSVSGAEARLASAVPAFADQLTAFEVWLDFNSNYEGRPPEQLPVVLQVLLSQAHRLRALQLLRRFLDLGPWAVNLALSVGIFPYVLKLLQSPAVELRQVLVHIWARILGLDPSCRTDLVKDNTYLYFITHLSSNDVPPEQRVMAAFILTVIMDDNRAGQRDCLKKGVHKTCAQFLFHSETQDMPEFRRWLCFCLGKLCAEHQDARHVCLQHDVHGNLLRLVVSSPHAEVRAAAVYALGTLLGSTDPVRAAAGSGGPSGSSAPGSAQSSSSSIASLSMSLEHGVGGAGGPGPQHHQRQWSSPPLSGNVYDSETKRRTDVAVIGVEMLRAFDDASPLVRREAILALYLLITDPVHLPYFVWIAHEMVRFSVEHVRQQQDAGSANRPNRTQPASAAGDGGVPHSAAVKRQATGQHRAASQMQDEQDEQEPSWWGDEDPSQRAAEEMDAGVGHRVNGTATPPASSLSSPSGLEGRTTPRHTAAKTSDWYQALVARLRREGGDIAEQYLHVWLAVRQVHHREPMALIAETAGHIVHVVHEKTLDLTRPESAIAAPQLSRSTSVQTRVSSATNPTGGGRGPSLGRGLPGPTQTQPVTAASGRVARPAAPVKDVQLPGGVPPLGVTAEKNNGIVPPVAPNGPIHPAQHGSRGGLSPHQHSAVVPPGGPRLPPRVPLERPALERTSSAREFRSSSKPQPPGGDDRSSLGSGVAQASAAVDQVVPPQPPLVRHLSLAHKVDAAANHPAGVSTSPAAPESSSLRWLRGQYRDMNLYAWSRRKFSRPDQQGPQAGEEDPLSPEGELLLYRKARNRRALEEAEQLAQKCASILGVPAPDDDSDLLDGLDLLMSIKAPASAQPANGQQKGPTLKLEQKTILESNAGMTSLLTFHPFENVLVSADEHHSITVWNYEEGKRLGVFSNGNMKPFRLTMLGWLNETSSSLLYTGSDDGVIRVWKGAAETLDPWTPPRLTTAFYAHALVGGGSGLVTKWLPKSGLLVTGGSTDRIRAWDLRREQIVREWNTGGDACVTTMTASCSRPADMPHRAAPPMPPSSLVVAGMGDGKVKIYDLRMERPVGVQSEHQNWVVLADFVKGDRELITGALTGDIKFWDLRRMNQPLRSVEVGKGPMTAMAVHRTCPIMASGSYNQFIKVLTLEGETLNVIRYHEGILALRIGPVATLAFHPLKLLLAAGATDSNIAIYSPSSSLNVNSAHR